MSTDDRYPHVDVPLGYPTSIIYMDESGSRATGNSFFTVAAAKVRAHGKLMRQVQSLRDQTGFHGELKFNGINRGSLSTYYGLIDLLEASDLHISACVVDSSIYDPFKRNRARWRVHADIASQLLVGTINRRELVTVMMDGITTPADVAVDDIIRTAVNRRLASTSVVGVACLNSKSSDGLQIADLVAGAIGFERRGTGTPNSHKAKVVGRLKAALGVNSFADGRCTRVNVQTLAPRRKRARPSQAPGTALKVVS